MDITAASHFYFINPQHVFYSLCVCILFFFSFFLLSINKQDTNKMLENISVETDCRSDEEQLGKTIIK